MIRIGRFIFDKFLQPPQIVQEEGIQWLHFIRQNQKPSTPEDTEELKRIIEENKPESDKILYIYVIDKEVLAKKTGHTPQEEGKPKLGSILVLKGTQEEALKYIRQIADRVH